MTTKFGPVIRCNVKPSSVQHTDPVMIVIDNITPDYGPVPASGITNWMLTDIRLPTDHVFYTDTGVDITSDDATFWGLTMSSIDDIEEFITAFLNKDVPYIQENTEAVYEMIYTFLDLLEIPDDNFQALINKIETNLGLDDIENFESTQGNDYTQQEYKSYFEFIDDYKSIEETKNYMINTLGLSKREAQIRILIFSSNLQHIALDTKCSEAFKNDKRLDNNLNVIYGRFSPTDKIYYKMVDDILGD